jgi:hypothetical protein
VTNIGQGVKFLSQRDPLPTAVNVGVAAPLDRVTFVLEANHLVPERQTQAGLGAELGVGPIAFRVGYLAYAQGGDLARKDQKAGAALGGLSTGIGIKAGIVRFDYAMSQQAPDYGPTQRVSLSIRWGERVIRGLTGREWGNDRSEWLLRSYDRN